MLERTIPLDLSVQISTPENIRFEYRLAGPFRRLPAFILDFVLRLTTITIIVMGFTCSGIAGMLPFSGAAFAFLLLISLFLLEWFYGLLFEVFWNGQTPGKKLLGLRAISIDGRPINAVQATIRNFLRLADFFPFVPLNCIFADLPGWVPIFTVGIASMALTSRMQRLGDIAAGTMVVVDEKTWFTRHAKIDDPLAAQLSEHIPPNFVMSRSLAQTIALYVERRALIGMGRRLELASKLASPLLRQFGFRDDTSPDLLLCALYHRDFIAKSSDSFGLADSPSPRQQELSMSAASPYLPVSSLSGQPYPNAVGFAGSPVKPSAPPPAMPVPVAASDSDDEPSVFEAEVIAEVEPTVTQASEQATLADPTQSPIKPTEGTHENR
jgi:uncharacterized RDD family membrane protein YckC